MNCASLWRRAACVALGGALLGCTGHTSGLNAPLGDCTGAADASCGVTIPNPGSGGGPGDAGIVDSGAGGIVEDAEAGFCGLDQFLVMSGVRAFPACNECIFNSPCCQSETVCANDPTCFETVACVTATGCTGSVCVATCQTNSFATPTGMFDYADFAGCVTNNCAAQCTFLSPIGDL